MPSENRHSSRRSERSGGTASHVENDVFQLAVLRMPPQYKWQDVKDILRQTAPVRQVHVQNTPKGRMSTSDLVGREEAIRTYERIRNEGFDGHPVSVALMEGSGDEARCIMGPTDSPNPTHRNFLNRTPLSCRATVPIVLPPTTQRSAGSIGTDPRDQHKKMRPPGATRCSSDGQATVSLRAANQVSQHRHNAQTWGTGNRQRRRNISPLSYVLTGPATTVRPKPDWSSVTPRARQNGAKSRTSIRPDADVFVPADHRSSPRIPLIVDGARGDVRRTYVPSDSEDE